MTRAIWVRSRTSRRVIAKKKIERKGKSALIVVTSTAPHRKSNLSSHRLWGGHTTWQKFFAGWTEVKSGRWVEGDVNKWEHSCKARVKIIFKKKFRVPSSLWKFSLSKNLEKKLRSQKKSGVTRDVRTPNWTRSSVIVVSNIHLSANLPWTSRQPYLFLRSFLSTF